MEKETKTALEKAKILNKELGEEASVWEVGFVAAYCQLMENQDRPEPLEYHIHQAKTLMRNMMKHKLVEDKSDFLIHKVTGENFFKKEKTTTLSDYVQFLSDKTLKNKKNKNTVLSSIACGQCAINGVEFEVRLSLEPRKEKWLGEGGNVEFLDV